MRVRWRVVAGYGRAVRDLLWRPGLILLVILAAAGCLALGWWQWGRYQSLSGTAQNLGYALQWPLFAGFVLFAYVRFVRLERSRDRGSASTEAPARAAHSKPVPMREIPAGILPARPVVTRTSNDDPVIAAYNRYLADLNAKDWELNAKDLADRSGR